MNTTKKFFAIILVLALVSCATLNESKYVSNVDHTEWSKNASIYEVNIRQYTPEGTFKAFEKHLPKLKELGVDILWLMPIHPIGELNRKGTLGSYYSIKDYKGVNPEFGTKEDFQHLVNKIHVNGMYIIIDWVANHTAWDHHWTKTNPEFYTKDSTGNFVPPVDDWSDVIDLNYENADLRKEMTDALKYWVTDFNIDGYRCDVADMVPTDFWDNARKELDKIKPVFMLAESGEPELQVNAFDMTYDWKLKDIMNEIAAGKLSADTIKNHYLVDQKKYPLNSYRMNFTTNHDENTWNGTVYERLGEQAEPLAVLISTVPGMPLVYSGQEAGLDKRLDFFEKDLIDWKSNKMYEVFQKLLKEKDTNKALWNGESGGAIKFLDTHANNVLAFYREKEDNKVLAIINLSSTNIGLNLNTTDYSGKYKNLFTDEIVEVPEKFKVSINANEYLVLVD